MTPLFKKGSGRFWRYLTNAWTVLFFVLIVEDFLNAGAYAHLIGPVASIYAVSLAIYSAEKEFERWQFYFIGAHPGEIYVVLWTLLIMGIIVADYFLEIPYKMEPEIISTYIVVLGVLAITKKSKEIFKERCESRE